MIWSLDLDDFSGKFCRNGRYPLLNAINSEFKGVQKVKSSVREPEMGLIHGSWKSLTTEMETGQKTGSTLQQNEGITLTAGGMGARVHGTGASPQLGTDRGALISGSTVEDGGTRSQTGTIGGIFQTGAKIERTGGMQMGTVDGMFETGKLVEGKFMGSQMGIGDGAVKTGILVAGSQTGTGGGTFQTGTIDRTVAGSPTGAGGGIFETGIADGTVVGAQTETGGGMFATGNVDGTDAGTHTGTGGGMFETGIVDRTVTGAQTGTGGGMFDTGIVDRTVTSSHTGTEGGMFETGIVDGSIADAETGKGGGMFETGIADGTIAGAPSGSGGGMFATGIVDGTIAGAQSGSGGGMFETGITDETITGVETGTGGGLFETNIVDGTIAGVKKQTVGGMFEAGIVDRTAVDAQKGTGGGMFESGVVDGSIAGSQTETVGGMFETGIVDRTVAGAPKREGGGMFESGVVDGTIAGAQKGTEGGMFDTGIIDAKISGKQTEIGEGLFETGVRGAQTGTGGGMFETGIVDGTIAGTQTEKGGGMFETGIVGGTTAGTQTETGGGVLKNGIVDGIVRGAQTGTGGGLFETAQTEKGGGMVKTGIVDGTGRGEHTGTGGGMFETGFFDGTVRGTQTGTGDGKFETGIVDGSIADVHTGKGGGMLETGIGDGTISGAPSGSGGEMFATGIVDGTIAGAQSGSGGGMFETGIGNGIITGTQTGAGGGMSETVIVDGTVRGTQMGTEGGMFETAQTGKGGGTFETDIFDGRVGGAQTGTGGGMFETGTVDRTIAGAQIGTGGGMFETGIVDRTIAGAQTGKGSGIIETGIADGTMMDAQTGRGDGMFETGIVDGTVSGAETGTGGGKFETGIVDESTAGAQTWKERGIFEIGIGDGTVSGAGGEMFGIADGTITGTQTVTGGGLFETGKVDGTIAGVKKGTVGGMFESGVIDGKTEGAQTRIAPAGRTLQGTVKGTVIRTGKGTLQTGNLVEGMVMGSQMEKVGETFQTGPQIDGTRVGTSTDTLKTGTIQTGTFVDREGIRLPFGTLEGKSQTITSLDRKVVGPETKAFRREIKIGTVVGGTPTEAQTVTDIEGFKTGIHIEGTGMGMQSGNGNVQFDTGNYVEGTTEGTGSQMGADAGASKAGIQVVGIRTGPQTGTGSGIFETGIYEEGTDMGLQAGTDAGIVQSGIQTAGVGTAPKTGATATAYDTAIHLERTDTVPQTEAGIFKTGLERISTGPQVQTDFVPFDTGSRVAGTDTGLTMGTDARLIETSTHLNGKGPGQQMEIGAGMFETGIQVEGIGTDPQRMEGTGTVPQWQTGTGTFETGIQIDGSGAGQQARTGAGTFETGIQVEGIGAGQQAKTGAGTFETGILVDGIGVGQEARTGAGSSETGIKAEGRGTGQQTRTGAGTFETGIQVDGIGTGQQERRGPGTFKTGIQVEGIRTDQQARTGTGAFETGIQVEGIGMGMQSETSAGTFETDIQVEGTGTGPQEQLGSEAFKAGIQVVGADRRPQTGSGSEAFDAGKYVEGIGAGLQTRSDSGIVQSGIDVVGTGVDTQTGVDFGMFQTGIDVAGAGMDPQMEAGLSKTDTHVEGAATDSQAGTNVGEFLTGVHVAGAGPVSQFGSDAGTFQTGVRSERIGSQMERAGGTFQTDAFVAERGGTGFPGTLGGAFLNRTPLEGIRTAETKVGIPSGWTVETAKPLDVQGGTLSGDLYQEGQSIDIPGGNIAGISSGISTGSLADTTQVGAGEGGKVVKGTYVVQPIQGSSFHLVRETSKQTRDSTGFQTGQADLSSGFARGDISIKPGLTAEAQDKQAHVQAGMQGMTSNVFAWPSSELTDKDQVADFKTQTRDIPVTDSKPRTTDINLGIIRSSSIKKEKIQPGIEGEILDSANKAAGGSFLGTVEQRSSVGNQLNIEPQTGTADINFGIVRTGSIKKDKIQPGIQGQILVSANKAAGGSFLGSVEQGSSVDTSGIMTVPASFESGTHRTGQITEAKDISKRTEQGSSIVGTEFGVSDIKVVKSDGIQTDSFLDGSQTAGFSKASEIQIQTDADFKSNVSPQQPPEESRLFQFGSHAEMRPKVKPGSAAVELGIKSNVAILGDSSFTTASQPVVSKPAVAVSKSQFSFEQQGTRPLDGTFFDQGSGISSGSDTQVIPTHVLHDTVMSPLFSWSGTAPPLGSEEYADGNLMMDLSVHRTEEQYMQPITKTKSAFQELNVKSRDFVSPLDVNRGVSQNIVTSTNVQFVDKSFSKPGSDSAASGTNADTIAGVEFQSGRLRTERQKTDRGQTTSDLQGNGMKFGGGAFEIGTSKEITPGMMHGGRHIARAQAEGTNVVKPQGMDSGSLTLDQPNVIIAASKTDKSIESQIGQNTDRGQFQSGVFSWSSNSQGPDLISGDSTVTQVEGGMAKEGSFQVTGNGRFQAEGNVFLSDKPLESGMQIVGGHAKSLQTDQTGAVATASKMPTDTSGLVYKEGTSGFMSTGTGRIKVGGSISSPDKLNMQFPIGESEVNTAKAVLVNTGGTMLDNTPAVQVPGDEASFMTTSQGNVAPLAKLSDVEVRVEGTSGLGTGPVFVQNKWTKQATGHTNTGGVQSQIREVGFMTADLERGQAQTLIGQSDKPKVMVTETGPIVGPAGGVMLNDKPQMVQVQPWTKTGKIVVTDQGKLNIDSPMSQSQLTDIHLQGEGNIILPGNDQVQGESKLLSRSFGAGGIISGHQQGEGVQAQQKVAQFQTSTGGFRAQEIVPIYNNAQTSEMQFHAGETSIKTNDFIPVADSVGQRIVSSATGSAEEVAFTPPAADLVGPAKAGQFSTVNVQIKKNAEPGAPGQGQDDIKVMTFNAQRTGAGQMSDGQGEGDGSFGKQSSARLIVSSSALEPGNIDVAGKRSAVFVAGGGKQQTDRTINQQSGRSMMPSGWVTRTGGHYILDPIVPFGESFVTGNGMNTHVIGLNGGATANSQKFVSMAAREFTANNPALKRVRLSGQQNDNSQFNRLNTQKWSMSRAMKTTGNMDSNLLNVAGSQTAPLIPQSGSTAEGQVHESTKSVPNRVGCEPGSLICFTHINQVVVRNSNGKDKLGVWRKTANTELSSKQNV